MLLQLCFEEGPSLSYTADPRDWEHVEDSVVGFPYVEGPPGMVAHYLWRVFMLVGWCVLDFWVIEFVLGGVYEGLLRDSVVVPC